MHARSLWLALGVAFALASVAQAEGSFDLYRSGRSEEARALALSELAAAEARGEPRGVWSHLMHVAWLEESLGDHKRAVQHATRALEVARRLGGRFETGRSLCWLGWSYTSLGLYPLALELYAEAIALATDGEKIAHPMVWGLATQETGALYARMGALDDAQPLLELTIDYARRHGIDVGIAEGGAHLAEIALEQGRVERARELADEAVQAAERCGCSPYNTARAMIVRARADLERARLDAKYLQAAVDRIEAAHAYAKSVGDRRHVAEAQLLRAQTLSRDSLDERVRLVSQATELLVEMESELRGRAEAQLGSLFLESEQDALAAVYLESGLDVSRELFRALDEAYVTADLAELDAIAGDTRRALEGWEASARQAEASGAWTLALHAQERLSETLQELGYDRLALDWTERGLHSVDALLERTPEGASRRPLLERRFALAERAAEIRLELAPAATLRP